MIRIGETQVDSLEAEGEAPLRDAAFSVLAQVSPDQPVRLLIRRGTEQLDMAIIAPSGCRTLVEVLTQNELVARSDGRVIQLSVGIMDLVDDDGLAAIFAHELGHTVLAHRRRLEAAGVEKGLLGEFGRNQQLNRRVEVEADRISVHLLANAGHDPAIAPGFWHSPAGTRAGGGVMRSFTYPSASARGDLIAQEIALYLPLGRGPSWPGHLLALRDQEF